MRGLTPAERAALIEMMGDVAQDEDRRQGWPWPESVVSRLLKDKRAHIFICTHCSIEFGGIVEHIDATNLGRMALRLTDTAHIKV